MTFQQLVAQAKLATPGCVLTGADREGLLNRARNMGLSESAAIEIIDATPCAKRILDDWRRVK